MLKRFLSITCASVLILLSVSHSLQATTVNLNKARDFIEKGEYSLAAPLLEEILSVTPDRVEAQYLLGICRLWRDDLEGADEYFQKAFVADTGTATIIIGEFEDFIIAHLGEGQVELAKEAFDLLIKYQPSIKARVLSACVDRGEAYLREGQDREADNLFRFAASYHGALKERICDIFFLKARAAAGEESLKLVLASIRYGDKYQDETARMVLRLANFLEDPAVREGYLKEALDFIDPEVVFNSSVEYFTKKWGPPQKITLVEPERWIGVEKGKEKEKICYLSRESLVTRYGGGRLVLEPTILSARPFTGSETDTDRGYFTEIWFSMDESPVTVFFWIRD